MDLTFKTAYWDDAAATAAFSAFMIEIHQLDFTEWTQLGYWDNAYTPFSYFEGDRVVANVCIYLLDSVLHGKETRLVQISGVGTDAAWRRKGLSRKLTKLGLEWAAGNHEGIFFFANPGAISFYKKSGFAPIEEYLEYITPTPLERRPGALKLEVDNKANIEKIYRYAQNRTPASNVFSVMNARLVMFHVLYTLRDCVFEIPALDCLVFCRREERTLHIYDIIGAQMPRFADIYPFLADRDDEYVMFHFFTDKLDLQEKSRQLLTGNNSFVKSPFPIPEPVFPYTARA